MKRKICIILCACFLMSCMVVPASASEVNGFASMELLDYGGVNGTNSRSVEYTEPIKFNLPYSMPIGYVDIILRSTRNVISSCTVSNSAGSAAALVVRALGNDLFRVYGQVSMTWGSWIQLDFGLSGTGAAYLSFYSVEVATTRYLGTHGTGFFAIVDSGFKYQTYPGEAVTYYFGGIQDTYAYSPFTAYIYAENYMSYDFIEYSFQMDVADIQSISANLDGVILPCEISYVDLESGSNFILNPTDGYMFREIPKNAVVRVVVDLTQVDRANITSYPQLTITGNFNDTINFLNSFTLLDIWGFVDIDDPEPVLFFLQRIYYTLSNDLKTLLTNISDRISNTNIKLSTIITTLSESLPKLISDQTDALKTEFTNLKFKLGDLFMNVQAWIVAQTQAIQTEFTVLSGQLSTWFLSLETKVANKLEDVRSEIQSQFVYLDGWIKTQTTALKASLKSLQDEVYYQFSQLKIWIETQTATLENAIRGDTAPGDAFQDEVDDKDKELDDMAAVMDSVARPDNVELSVEGYVDLNDVGQAAQPLTVVLTSELFFPIFMMSFIMCTMGYLLYGKR